MKEYMKEGEKLKSSSEYLRAFDLKALHGTHGGKKLFMAIKRSTLREPFLHATHIREREKERKNILRSTYNAQLNRKQHNVHELS